MRFISRALSDLLERATVPGRALPVARSGDVQLHPMIDAGLPAGGGTFGTAELRCACNEDPATIEVGGPITHSRLCGCTRCWKPEGALFGWVAFADARSIRVTGGEAHLEVVDPSVPIRRRVCARCGIHLFGLVEDEKHAFHKLALVHPDRATDGAWPAPRVATYVSAVIESGTLPRHMPRIRERLSVLGLDAYDCLQPELMERIAARRARETGVLL